MQGAREDAAAAMREQLVPSPHPPSEPEPEEPLSDAAERRQQELNAEGNVVSACSIFSASVVLDALNALPSTLVVDVPVSLRTTALVLITMVAAPPIASNILVRQRVIACVLLAVTAWLAAHQGGVNARIADALYSLLCGWAVIVIFGLRGPKPGERGHDSRGRRENVTALAAAFLGYAGARIVRAGFYHAPEVAQFTASHGDITARGFAMADDVVASTMVFGGLLCVSASVIVLSNYEAIYEHGCSPVCRVMGHLSVLVFTAAFVVQVVAYANLDALEPLFGAGACAGDADVCEASYRARRLHTANSSAAPLWACAVGMTIFAFPHNRRCRTRRDYHAYLEEEHALRGAANASGLLAAGSFLVASAVVYCYADHASWWPSIELMLLYVSIPIAWFGSAWIACATHAAGIVAYTVGRVGSAFGFDFAYLTHWFVAATLVLVLVLSVTTFVSWLMYSSCVSHERFIPWLENVTALSLVALVSIQLFLTISSLAIVSGYDGGLVEDTASWRAASLQWCSQHTTTFFFSAALVGGRFEVYNDSIRRWVLRLAWFAVPVLLAACWSVSIAASSATVPYGTTGDGTSIVIAVLAAAAPWFITGIVVC